MGLIWGLFSVIIASVAQLSLGFAASHLPPMTHLWDFIAVLLAFVMGRKISINPLIIQATPSSAFSEKVPSQPGSTIEAIHTST